MKKILSIAVKVLLFAAINSNLQAAPFDTGMITIKQPNGVEFIGRMWGDEFIWWAETEDGYRFIETGDGWYCYATLNQNGEYAPTKYKVGIDSPPASAYLLERTQARLEEIKEQIEQFNEQIELNRQWYEQKQAEAQGQPVTLKIGIILIEFTDTTHYTDSLGNRPNGYFTSDFDSMMFSYNYWYDTTGVTPHPENEKIFGSFRDYWYQMSKGKLRFEGKVVNPDTTGDGVPEWIMADTTRTYYADPTVFSWGDDSLANEAIYKAKQYGYITDTPGPKYYDKLVIVYAQFARKSGALMVHAEDIGGKFIILGERSGPDLFGGLDEEKSFTHIGIYAHELAHTFGLYDEYPNKYEDGETDLFNFCLMARGIYNGPDRKAACPATLSPFYRINYGWLPQPTKIENDTANFYVEYNYDYPKIYRIDPINSPGNMHYLFEVRQREGFDLYIPAPPETFPNEQPGTLIIWQDSIESTWPPGTSNIYTDRIRIKPADFYPSYYPYPQTQLNDFFPSEGYQNYQFLNDTTKPAASLGDNMSGELLTWFTRPAHFELKGIQKLQDHNTEIDEIKLNHAIIRNKITSGWKTVSVGAILSNYSASTVFPTAVDSIVREYIPGQGYVVRDTLKNGPGYFVNFSSAQTLVHSGFISDSLNIPVVKGWNLIGSISDKVPKLNICTIPPQLISIMYYYDRGYKYITNGDSLKPGIGYWLNSADNGNIILLRNFECPESEEFNLAEMDKFIITDADGKTQDLYVANADIDTSITGFDRSLPPSFPEMDFDVRFNYGEFIKAVSVDSGEIDLEIDVQTNAYPITLSWEINPANGIEYSFISDSGFSKISIINNIHHKLTISNKSQGKIKLFGKVNNSSNTQMPFRFELFQNYPNPFNPVTTIKFSIPKESQVNLSVFNILGEKVKELKNEFMKPGFYEVNYDATQLASGIYFYRIQADTFVQTKKMILVK